MDLTYFAWGSGAMAVQVLRALALLSTAPQVSGALATAALLGLLLLATVAAFNPTPHAVTAPLRLVLAVALISGVLLMPVRVTVTDRLAANSVSQSLPLVPGGDTVVSDVPFGVALPAWVFSNIGQSLTRGIDTAMGPPAAEDRLSSAGLWLSARALRAMAAPPGAFTDPNLPGDFHRFVLNCKLPALENATNDLRHLTQGRLVEELGDNTGGVTSVHHGAASLGALVPVSCAAAWDGTTLPTGQQVVGLGERLELEGIDRQFRACLSLQGIALAVNQAQRAALVAHARTARLDGECGRRAFANALEVFGYGTNVTDQFTELVAIELMRDSAHSLSSHDPNGLALAGFVGRRQRDAAYVIAGELASLALPALRGLLEAVLLTFLPVLLIIGVLFFDQIGRYLRNGLVLVLWLQLWPPVMAVVNSIGLWVQVAAINEHAVAGVGRFTLVGIDALLADLDTQLALSRYMLTLVPLLAWSLVRAGEFGGAMLAGRLLQPGEAAAYSAGSHAATNNWSMDQVNLSPRTSVGPHVATVGDSWGGTTTIHPDMASFSLPANRPGHVGMRHAETVSEGLRRASEETQTQASSQAQVFSSSVEDAYRSAYGQAGVSRLANLRESGVSDETALTALQGETQVIRQTEAKLRSVGQSDRVGADIQGSLKGSLGVDIPVDFISGGLGFSHDTTSSISQDVVEEMGRQYGQLDERTRSAMTEAREALSTTERASVTTTFETMTSDAHEATVAHATSSMEQYATSSEQAQRLSQASEMATTTGTSVIRDMLSDPRQAGFLAEFHRLYHGERMDFDSAWQTAQENTGTTLDTDALAERILNEGLAPQPQPVVDPTQQLEARSANLKAAQTPPTTSPAPPAQLDEVADRVHAGTAAVSEGSMPVPGPEHYDPGRTRDSTVTTTDGDKYVTSNESMFGNVSERWNETLFEKAGVSDRATVTNTNPDKPDYDRRDDPPREERPLEEHHGP